MRKVVSAVFVVLLLAGLVSAQLQYQNMIPVPSYGSTFASATLTRGFGCQIPTDLTVIGLRVPDEKAQGQQFVCLYKNPTSPPAWSGTVNLTPAFSKFSEPSKNIIPCSVNYKKGEWLVVLGACSTTLGGTMNNSYATPVGPFQAKIFGLPTTLIRCGTQNNISSLQPPHPVWTESGSAIARVEVYVASATITGSGTPSPGKAVDFTLSAAGDAGLTYQVGSSFGTGPIPLGTRNLGLSLDKLLELSTGGLAPAVFVNYAGALDKAGAGKAQLAIPNLPILKGIRIYTAFVTVQAAAPLGIKSISNTFMFSIL